MSLGEAIASAGGFTHKHVAVSVERDDQVVHRFVFEPISGKDSPLNFSLQHEDEIIVEKHSR